MAEPQRKQYPVPWGNVLDESATPQRAADNGSIVGALNVVYKRNGAYGIRPGALEAYIGSVGNTAQPYPVTGTRWYRTLPTPLTQVALIASNAFYTATLNPATGGIPAALTQQAVFNASKAAASFCSAYDPVLQKDVLIMCGQGGSTSIGAPFAFSGGTFASAAETGTFAFIVTGAVTAGDVVTLHIGGGITATTLNYTVTAADNVVSVCQNLATLINNSAIGQFGATPALSQAVAGSTVLPLYGPETVGGVWVYGLNAAVTGTYYLSTTGALETLFPLVGAPGSFGPSALSQGPLKWDGTTLSAISGSINVALQSVIINLAYPYVVGGPTGCVSWHNHVWYWGYQSNPNTLYASDINQPENCSFMLQNGGYPIGLGDGDPGIQAVVPLGNILYVFKSNSIYAITGYDFQAGEYQFNVQPAIRNCGVPGPGCVATLRDALVFWNGSSFRRLAPGALETEDIGSTIPYLQGSFALNAGSQQYVQAIAGTFSMATGLAGAYGSGTQVSFSNCAYFLMSNNGTSATTMMVYDDDASQFIGAYAWSPWTLPASATTQQSGLMAFGGGPDSTNTYIEQHQLMLLGTQPNGYPTIYQHGAGEITPLAANIYTLATGWITCTTPALSKELHQIYLEVQATANVIITATVYPSIYIEQRGTTTNYAPQAVTFAPTAYQAGYAVSEQYQILQATLKPFLRGNAFQIVFTVTESGGVAPQFEILGVVLDYVESPFEP